MRKRAREEVETVPAIHMDALQGVAIDEDGEAVAALHTNSLISEVSTLQEPQNQVSDTTTDTTGCQPGHIQQLELPFL